MKSKLITMLVVAAVLGGIVVLNQFEPQRMAQAQYEAEAEVAEAQENVHTPFEEALKFNKDKLAVADIPGVDTTEPTMEVAVATIESKDYLVTFECSNGEIVLEVSSDLAPLGAAQFKKAVEDGVYDGARFFRVISGFMAQFGIPGDPGKAAKWEKMKIKDDPVKASNTRGTVTFATSGKDSRTTQLFINYGNNARLDGMGFSPFARVIKGMDVVDSIFSGHGERPNQASIQQLGNTYLESKFPELDYIKKATISAIPIEEESKSDDA